MMPATQVKLLRVLQERMFRRLGGRQEISVDVRVIAATNVVPQEAVNNGKLREDLFYRLNVFALDLPPLRERREDIPLLVQSFLNEFNRVNGKAVRAVDQEAMYLLERYPWPGNIRELRNVIERATILADSEFIEPKHLPPTLITRGEESLPTMTISPGTTVDEAERRLILLTLDHTRNNKTRAAEILGISLKTLHNKLNRMKDETGATQLVLAAPRVRRRGSLTPDVDQGETGCGRHDPGGRGGAGAERVPPGDAGETQPAGDRDARPDARRRRSSSARGRSSPRRRGSLRRAARGRRGAIDPRVERRLFRERHLRGDRGQGRDRGGAPLPDARGPADGRAGEPGAARARRHHRAAARRVLRSHLRNPAADARGGSAVRIDPDRRLDPARAQRAAATRSRAPPAPCSWRSPCRRCSRCCCRSGCCGRST